METFNYNFSNLKSTDDIDDFLNNYRGSGIQQILQKQFSELYQQDEQQAFSSLGNFLNYFIEHHKSNSNSQEMRDDYMYKEVQELLDKMSKDSKYSEYSDYLIGRIQEMQAANLLKNQDAK